MANVTSLLMYLAVFTVAALLVRNGIKRNRKYLSVLGVSLPIVLSGLRAFVGTDYATYVAMFERYSTMTWLDYSQLSSDVSVEPSFFFISKILGIFTSDPWILFFVTSAITISVAYIGIRRLAGNATPLAFFLFLLITLPFTLNAVRQGMAIAVVIFAISYIVKGNPIKYVISILAASLFHSSVLIMIPAYLLRFVALKNRLDANLTFIVSALVAIGGIALIPIVLSVIAYIPILGGYLEYLGQGVGVSIVMVGLKLIPIVIMILTYRKMTARMPHMKLLAILMFAELATYTLGGVSGFFLRISYYFSIAAFVYLASMPLVYKHIQKRLVLFVTLLYGLLYFVVIYFIAGYSEIFPYQTIFQGVVE